MLQQYTLVDKIYCLVKENDMLKAFIQLNSEYILPLGWLQPSIHVSPKVFILNASLELMATVCIPVSFMRVFSKVWTGRPRLWHHHELVAIKYKYRRAGRSLC